MIVVVPRQTVLMTDLLLAAAVVAPPMDPFQVDFQKPAVVGSFKYVHF